MLTANHICCMSWKKIGGGGLGGWHQGPQTLVGHGCYATDSASVELTVMLTGLS